MSGRTLTKEEIRLLLPDRPRDSHKGANGHALLCVGSGRYTGAALMSAAAALRAGCGVLTVAVPGGVKNAFSALPEACCTAVSTGDEWDEDAQRVAISLLPGKRALGMGCGMGTMETPLLLAACLRTGLPMLLDADGLNLLSRHPELHELLHENVVLTPHPGEMSRLTGKSIGEITGHMEETALQAASAWRCTVLLKGAQSCISDGKRIRWNETGNPGLAKGGSGDVLAGLITGLLAQGLAPFDAACAGAYLLGVSADTALKLLGTRMLMAGDVITAIRQTLGAIGEGEKETSNKSDVHTH